MTDYPVIDADGHVQEVVADLQCHLAPEWRRPSASLLPGDGFDRNLQGHLGHQPKGPADQLAAMDQDGIDVMVMYPTLALGVGYHRDRGYGPALARAYNSYMAEFCAADAARLKFVAAVSPQDVVTAVEEMERAMSQLGAVGVMLPSHAPSWPDWGHRHWDPIYAAAEALDAGIAFHATMRGTVGLERFDNFIAIHAVGHPFEQTMALIGVIIGGVLDRFPRLRVAFLESGIGWVPYFMDRLDEEVEKRGAVEAPHLTARPSEYILGGRIYFGVECGEKTIPDGVRWGLDDTLLYSSDYPHWDSDWPHTVRVVRERGDLSEEVKRKLLSANALRFYGAGMLSHSMTVRSSASR